MDFTQSLSYLVECNMELGDSLINDDSLKVSI